MVRSMRALLVDARLSGRLAMVAALCATALACGSSATSSPNSTATTTLPPYATLEQHDYYFSPTLMSGSSTAATLTIQVHNVSDQQHTFTIDDLAIDVTVQPGETQNVTVKNITGTHTFYCRFHRNMGMVGTLPLSLVSPTR